MRPKLRVGLTAVALSLSLDQLSKYVVARELALGDRVPVIDGFFYFTHLRNPAASFGLFAGGDPSLRRGAFIALSLLGISIAAYLFRRLAAGDRRSALALGLILGGAMGNLVDRAFRGAVVDYLHFRLWASFAWPDFNLADSFIVVGTALFLFELLRAERAHA